MKHINSCSKTNFGLQLYSYVIVVLDFAIRYKKNMAKVSTKISKIKSPKYKQNMIRDITIRNCNNHSTWSFGLTFPLVVVELKSLFFCDRQDKT